MSNSPTTSQSSSSIPGKTIAEPTEIGTKGTIGSLIKREIAYSNRHKVDSRKHNAQSFKVDRRRNKFIPSICSAIDVDNINGPKLV
ncbi:hypothetical protein SSX86_008717 [Deinandra increscens subsp. villosa]|uniref:Uncharacterized protein n=1 Tax=Deinandra increscens subsp. villosa TaxID=3103831 RepID=A0AAP0H496_9ASTR